MTEQTRGVVMLYKSGGGADSQWFEYRPAFYQDIVRIEWDLETMEVVLPVETADALIRHGWAREMTSKEELMHTNKNKKTEVEEPPKPAPKPPKKETEK